MKLGYLSGLEKVNRIGIDSRLVGALQCVPAVHIEDPVHPILVVVQSLALDDHVGGDGGIGGGSGFRCGSGGGGFRGYGAAAAGGHSCGQYDAEYQTQQLVDVILPLFFSLESIQH